MFKRRLGDFIADDRGQDLVEYALTTATVTAGVLVSVVILALVMRFEYAGVQASVQAAWEPCAPGGCP